MTTPGTVAQAGSTPAAGTCLSLDTKDTIVTIAEIKLDLSMVDFDDAQAEQLIDAMDAVDWVTVAREAIREAMYVTASDPALVDMDAVQITKVEEDLF